MNSLSYSSNIFLRDIIQRAAWMYLRFALSFHDVKELLAERGITVTYVCISDNNGVPSCWVGRRNLHLRPTRRLGTPQYSSSTLP